MNLHDDLDANRFALLVHHDEVAALIGLICLIVRDRLTSLLDDVTREVESRSIGHHQLHNESFLKLFDCHAFLRGVILPK